MKRFYSEEQGGVVEYILIVGLSAIFALMVMPKTRVVSEDWLIYNGQTIMKNIGHTSPFQQYITTSNPNSSPPNFSVGVGGILEPNLQPSSTNALYYNPAYGTSSPVSFSATPISNGYKPVEPIYCQWTGYTGYTGTSCNPTTKATFPLGKHTVSVTMIDGLGAKGTASDTFVVGYSPVSFQLSIVPQQTQYQSSDYIQIQAQSVSGGDGKHYLSTWALDGKTLSATGLSLGPEQFPAGTHTITENVCSPNSSNCTLHTLSFTVNTSPPTEPSIVMSPTTNLLYNTPLTFSVGTPSTDIDGESFSYQWSTNGSSWSTQPPDHTFSVGSHTVYLRALNQYGQSSAVASLPFTIQNSPPTTPTLTFTTSNLVVNPNFSTWNGQSSVATGWSDSTSGNAKVSVVHTPTVSGTNAQQILLVGNASATLQQKLSVNPNASFIASGNLYLSSGAATTANLTLSFYNSQGTIIKTWQSKNITTSTPSYTKVSMAGVVPNTAVSAILSIPVQTNTDLTAYLDAFSYEESGSAGNTYSYLANTSFTFTAPSSDPDGDTVSETWNTDGVGTSNPPNGILSGGVGTHQISVFATDSNGANSTSAKVTLVLTKSPPLNPVLTLSPSGTIYAQMPVTFHASSMDPDGESVTYEWKLNQGSWTNTPPNQSFSPGTDTISVEAIDSSGSSSGIVSKTFTVEQPPVIAYSDSQYPTSWISNASAMTQFLQNLSTPIPTYNAQQLAAWMQDELSTPGKGMVVMTQDVCPNTICDATMSSNSLVHQYLESGGSMLWTGDIPFYYVGSSNGTRTAIGSLGQQNILGLSPPTSTSFSSVALATGGTQMGLSNTNIASQRSQPMNKNLVPLEYTGNQNDSSYFENFVKSIPYAGFYRYYDAPFNQSNTTNQNEIRQIIQFYEGHHTPAFPLPGAPTQLSCTGIGGSVTCSFTPNQSQVFGTLQYQLCSSSGTCSTWSTNTTEQVTGLAKSGTISVYAHEENFYGVGPNSAVSQVTMVSPTLHFTDQNGTPHINNTQTLSGSITNGSSGIPNAPVQFTISGGGTLSSNSTNTNANGNFSVTYTAPNSTGSVQICANAFGTQSCVSLSVQNPVLSIGTIPDTQIGKSTSILVTLTNGQGGSGLANQTITIASNLSGSFNTSTATTNVNGQASFTFTPTSTGTDTITATSDGVSATQSFMAYTVVNYENSALCSFADIGNYGSLPYGGNAYDRFGSYLNYCSNLTYQSGVTDLEMDFGTVYNSTNFSSISITASNYSSYYLNGNVNVLELAVSPNGYTWYTVGSNGSATLTRSQLNSVGGAIRFVRAESTNSSYAMEGLSASVDTITPAPTLTISCKPTYPSLYQKNMAITGTLKNPDGNPIANQTILIAIDAYGGISTYSVTTNALGNYSFNTSGSPTIGYFISAGFNSLSQPSTYC